MFGCAESSIVAGYCADEPHSLASATSTASTCGVEHVAIFTPLQPVPGYTILVLDTNILLSLLSMVTSLVESLCWTVPLPEIMELNTLASCTRQCCQGRYQVCG
jgi:hypothetical protein